MVTRLGPVHLTVADLARSADYYERGIGLNVRDRENGSATLGSGQGLLVLHEQPRAHPAGRTPGLFHFALLVPTRLELARAIQRANEHEANVTGASDHFVSEALYLRDPDGHGIEIYRDRPHAEWGIHEDGRIDIGTVPMDVSGVMATLEGAPSTPERVDDATVMGHVHLQASNLQPDRDFATGVLGLDVKASLPGQAEFLSWDGYHHHLGMNVWAGVGIPPAPPEAARLLHWTAHVDDPETTAERAGNAERRDDGWLVRDPSGTAVLLAPPA